MTFSHFQVNLSPQFSHIDDLIFQIFRGFGETHPGY